MNVRLKVCLLRTSARLPSRGTVSAAGLDLYACDPAIIAGAKVSDGKVTIGHGLVATGLTLAIPKGFVGRIGSRSGLSVDKNIEVGAGWIDPDYRGELFVELKNFGSDDFSVVPGARIAQLFVLPTANVVVQEADSLDVTVRGPQGFGSTGE